MSHSWRPVLTANLHLLRCHSSGFSLGQLVSVSHSLQACLWERHLSVCLFPRTGCIRTFSAILRPTPSSSTRGPTMRRQQRPIQALRSSGLSMQGRPAAALRLSCRCISSSRW